MASLSMAALRATAAPVPLQAQSSCSNGTFARSAAAHAASGRVGMRRSVGSTAVTSNVSVERVSPTGAYVHLPFCKRRCRYCSFPIVALGSSSGSSKGEEVMHRYTATVLKEITNSRKLNETPLETISFGGGTPSLLPMSMLGRILRALDDTFAISKDAEISIEIDPGTFDAARLQSYMNLGVNRFSVGIQAFQAELLAVCGRSHGAEEVERAIEALHAAQVPNWSLDLMSGLPHSTPEGWDLNLRRAIDARPSHVSVYDLQLEPGTPFGRQFAPGRAPLPTEAQAADMYRSASRTLQAAGYEHYEVSNFALPGRRSRHNLKYWLGEEFYGFGMGAASYVQGRRVTRPGRMGAYERWAAEHARPSRAPGASPPAGAPPVRPDSPRQQLADAIMLRLRLADGLDPSALPGPLRALFPARLAARALEPHARAGRVRVGLGPFRARLTRPEGFLSSNDVISDVLLALDDASEGA